MQDCECPDQIRNQWLFTFTKLANYYANLKAFGKLHIFPESQKRKSATSHSYYITMEY